MNKAFPVIDFPLLEAKEVSSPEFNLNVKSNSPGKIIYSTSDESIARVNQYGFVSTVCAGMVEIYAEQLETDYYESLKLCRTLLVNKSDQKLILRELLPDGNFESLTEITKKIGQRFTIFIDLNSDLDFEVLSVNSLIFDVFKISKGVYRFDPKKVGESTLIIQSKGNKCYNDLFTFLKVKITQERPMVVIDYDLSMFDTTIKHDALDEFTIITSNSGQQQLDNYTILQTTKDQEIGNGYFRDIGLINKNPQKLINYVDLKTSNCCNVLNTNLFINGLPSSSSSNIISSSSSSDISISSSSSLSTSSSSSNINEHIIVATEYQNVFISRDLGDTWTNITPRLDPLNQENRGWFDPGLSRDGKYIVLGKTRGSELRVSEDFGQTFTYVSNPAGAGTSGGVLLSPSCIQVLNGSVQYILNWGNLILKSSNLSTWERKKLINDPNGEFLLQYVFRTLAVSQNGQYQTVVGWGSKIWGSSDFGNTWSIKYNFFKNWIGVAMSDDGRYQTATAFNDRVYVSSNYGDTWSVRATVRQWRMVAMSSDGRYQTAVAEQDRIVRSEDYGVTWSSLNYNDNWWGVHMSKNGRYQVATSRSSGVYVSKDFGVTWELKKEIDPDDNQNLDPAPPGCSIDCAEGGPPAWRGIRISN
jgi:photosystem II stability/assembly factor-like uncharacterized protein